MGKSAPKAPAAPDPYATAQAQTQMNEQTARTNAALNRVNQVTPQGTLTYSNEGAEKYAQWNAEQTARRNADPAYQAMDDAWKQRNAKDWDAWLSANNPYAGQRDTWTATTTLSPEQQRLYDLATQGQTTYGEAANDLLTNARQALSTPVTADGLPGLSGAPQAGQLRTGIAPTTHGVRYEAADTGSQLRTFADVGGPQRNMGSPADFAQDRDAVEAALYARLTPQLERDRLALESRLANQGLTPGTEAWTRAVDDANRQSNDARLAVTAAGLQEQQGLFGMEAARFGAENAAQQQAYGQALGRGQFYNAAQSEDTQQALARTALWNAAQAQEYGQNAQDAAFYNQALQSQYNMGLAGAQMGNAARQQGVQERLALQQAPLNAANALLSGSQVQMPQFSNVPQVQVAPTDYLGAQQLNSQMLMNNYNQKNANYQANLAGQYGLANTFVQSGAYVAGQAGSNA